MTKKEVKASKTISYALRHNPEEFGITLDKEGWVDIGLFIAALMRHGCVVTRNQIQKIIVESDKKRFEIRDNKIRATYGHSVEQKIEYIPQEPPEFLYHGTSGRAYSQILTEGLKPMSRQYVHLSSDYETAIKVGLRHDSHPIILFVDAMGMYRDGFRFFHTANDSTWLCECVPQDYIYCVGPVLKNQSNAEQMEWFRKRIDSGELERKRQKCTSTYKCDREVM